MGRSRRARLALLALTACGGARSARAPVAPHTRYGVGDHVEYTFAGEFTPAPVGLSETVVARDGDRLRIDVAITRGAVTRRFAQVLTDTPENERNNVVDALYDLGGPAPVALDPRAGLLRVYEWTFVEPDGKATDVARAPCEKTIAGRAYACTCRTGRNAWRGRPVRFETSECEGFLWTHGPARFWYEATGADVLRVRVTTAGRVPVASTPLVP